MVLDSDFWRRVRYLGWASVFTPSETNTYP